MTSYLLHQGYASLVSAILHQAHLSYFGEPPLCHVTRVIALPYVGHIVTVACTFLAH